MNTHIHSYPYEQNTKASDIQKFNMPVWDLASAQDVNRSRSVHNVCTNINIKCAVTLCNHISKSFLVQQRGWKCQWSKYFRHFSVICLLKFQSEGPCLHMPVKTTLSAKHTHFTSILFLQICNFLIPNISYHICPHHFWGMALFTWCPQSLSIKHHCIHFGMNSIMEQT